MSKQSGRKRFTALTIDPTTLITTTTPSSEQNKCQPISSISYHQNVTSNKRGKIDPVLSSSHMMPTSPMVDADWSSTLSPHSSRPTRIVQYEHPATQDQAFSVVSPAVLPTSIAGGDMTLSVSTDGLRLIVRNCIKKELFKKMKFFHEEIHGAYNTDPDSVCGLVMQFCNISSVATEPSWWFDMKPIIKRTHTDHRNNCIKSMRLRFRGKYQYIVNNVTTTCAAAATDTNQICISRR